MRRHLWLIGMMGSGKTSVARELARRWEAQTADTDEVVARRTGCSIAQLWGERGEKAFREMEAAAVQNLAEQSPAVIATGGGVVLDDANVRAMRASGGVVWLSAPPRVLSQRVGAGRGRPLLEVDSSPARIEEILAERQAKYAAAADMTIETTTFTIEETADRIEEWWNPS